MHKVDPIQIMLSDIFDKVFYKLASNVKKCPDCDGEGIIELEVPRPQNFDRDTGVIDVTQVPCEECGGTGELEDEEPLYKCVGCGRVQKYCVGCGRVLRWDESENYCRWCEERMEKEA